MRRRNSKPIIKTTVLLLAAALVLAALILELAKPGPHAGTCALFDAGCRALNGAQSLQGNWETSLTVTANGKPHNQSEFLSFSRVSHGEDDMDIEAHFERRGGATDAVELGGVWYDDGFMYRETVSQEATLTRDKRAADMQAALDFLDMRPAFAERDVTSSEEGKDEEGVTVLTMEFREKAARKIVAEGMAAFGAEGKGIRIERASFTVLLDEDGMLISMAFSAKGAMRAKGTKELDTARIEYRSEYTRKTVNMTEAIHFPDRIYAFEEQQ